MAPNRSIPPFPVRLKATMKNRAEGGFLDRLVLFLSRRRSATLIILRTTPRLSLFIHLLSLSLTLYFFLPRYRLRASSRSIFVANVRRGDFDSSRHCLRRSIAPRERIQSFYSPCHRQTELTLLNRSYLSRFLRKIPFFHFSIDSFDYSERRFIKLKFRFHKFSFHPYRVTRSEIYDIEFLRMTVMKNYGSIIWNDRAYKSFQFHSLDIYSEVHPMKVN